jgi:hypothetical protein
MIVATERISTDSEWAALMESAELRDLRRVQVVDNP